MPLLKWSEREGIGPTMICESGDLPGEGEPILRQQRGFPVGFA